MTRRRVIYHGRVQGGGFRYTVRSIAGRHPVAGFVRNLSDGTVELVADAESPDLEMFLQDVASTLGGNITSTRDTPAPADALSGFRIRY